MEGGRGLDGGTRGTNWAASPSETTCSARLLQYSSVSVALLSHSYPSPIPGRPEGRHGNVKGIGSDGARVRRRGQTDGLSARTAATTTTPLSTHHGCPHVPGMDSYLGRQPSTTFLAQVPEPNYDDNLHPRIDRHRLSHSRFVLLAPSKVNAALISAAHRVPLPPFPWTGGSQRQLHISSAHDAKVRPSSLLPAIASRSALPIATRTRQPRGGTS